MSAVTGAKAYLIYGWEATFGDGATTKDKVFGRGLRVDGVNWAYDISEVYELYNRKLTDIVYRKFNGSASIGWLMSTPWFFKGLLGTVATTGTAAPYTHTFSMAESFTSMGVEIGVNADVPYTLDLSGAIMSRADISGAIDSVVSVSASYLYKDVTIGSTLGSSVTDSYPVYVIGDTSIEMPAGTVIGYVRDFRFTVNNNPIPVYELGSSNKLKEAVPGEFRIEGTMTIIHTKKDYISNFLNKTTYTDIKFKMTNGLTGADEKSITIDASDVYIVSHGGLRIEPNRIVNEGLTFRAKDVTVTAVNDTATAP